MRSLRLFFSLTCFITILIFHTPLRAETFFVDGLNGDDTNGGITSWANALRTIQHAIDSAETNDVIFVKEGTYEILEMIELNKEVSLYGGFAGFELSPEERDLSAHESRINGMDTATHCFLVTEKSVVDGFTLTGGHADGTGVERVGGGLLGSSTDITIRNCVFENNWANMGGGALDTVLCTVAITNCIFRWNESVSGGAIRFRESIISLSNSEFYENNSDFSSGAGGCIYLIFSDINITDCNFHDNTSVSGGAIFLLEGSLFIQTCSFSGNTASSAGGAVRTSAAVVTIIGSEFSANSAFSGSAIHLTGALENSYISRCKFFNNQCSIGTICLNDNSNIKIINSLLSGNVSQMLGGGFYISNSSPQIIHCTITQNSAYRGSGVICNSASYPDISNSIFWNNTVTSTSNLDIMNKELTAGVDLSQYSVSNSDIEQSVFDGLNGNIFENPLFMSLGYYDDNGTPSDITDDFWVPGNYSLATSSPCINAGEYQSEVSEDINRTVRPQGVNVDMGAYEVLEDDTTPPSIQSAVFDGTSVVITFSEAVDESSASNPNNYQFTPAVGITGITVSGSVVTMDTGELVDGIYDIYVSGVYDNSDNEMTGESISFTVDQTAPDQVTGLTAHSIESTSLSLEWIEPYDLNGISEYRIYQDGTLIGVTLSVGYDVVSLSPSTSYVFSVSAVDPFGNISAAASITASTTEMVYDMYTLTLGGVNGFIEPNPDQAEYISGESVELTAVADEGYMFSSWSGDASGSANPLSIVMDGDKVIEAIFVVRPDGVDTEGLEGYWRMDEGSGIVAYDSSGANINGSLSGGVSWSDGLTGTGVNFNGTSGFIDLGQTNFNLTDELSISLWVYMPQLMNQRMILIQKGNYVNPFMVSIEANNTVSVGLRTNNSYYMTSNTSLEAGVWNHIAVTYRSGERIIYINGVEDKRDAAVTGALSPSSSYNTIIGSTPAGSYWYTGEMDNICLYSRVLTPAEIDYLYKNEE